MPRAYTQLRVSYAAAELRRCRAETQADKARNERPQSKPATRPGVFEEPWYASWLWFCNI